jgi:outer membrane protein assembly factor BamB
VVVASYDPAGNPRWAEALGGTETADAISFSVAVDAAGNVVVGGSFLGTIDLGTGPLTSGQGRDAFVALLDPSGTPLWSRALGGAGDQSAQGVAVSATGYVVMTEAPFHSIDLGGGQLVPQTGPAPIVAAFDAAGHPMWNWGPGPETWATALACGKDNDVFVLLGTPGPDPDAGPAGADAFGLARLDGAGNLLSSHAFGSGIGSGLAARGPWLALIATAVGPVSLGGGPLIGSGDDDVLIAVMAP